MTIFKQILVEPMSFPKVIVKVIFMKIISLSKNHLDETISLVEQIFLYKRDQKIARINLFESHVTKKLWGKFIG